jgi:arsenite-transporting ATPase
LAAPDTVAAVAAVFDALQQEHRLIRDQLARVGGRPEVADRLIALLARQAHDTSARLQDPAQTSFHWVTLPEEMSVAESEDAIRALDRAGMHVSHIVVNNVLPDGDACPLCDRRRAAQRRVIALIRRRFGRGRTVRLVAAQLQEPRGLRALASLGRGASRGSRAAGDRARRAIVAVPARRPGGPFAIRRQQASRGAAPDAMRSFRGASLLFFGGKGGVGKTTVSAAAALQLAREDPMRRVLLLSTDPAHSLADVFGAPVGDTARTIFGAPRNLDVRELDAARAFAQRRAEIEAALDEIASTIGAGGGAESTAAVHVRGPSSAASQLINLAPPGIDELFGILSVFDVRGAYGLIVVDTAPTGHALRLLEMPDTAREWTQVLLRMLLKYRALVRPGRLAEELVAVSKSIRELQILLHDATRTRFIVVTRAAGVPMRETRRLLARVRRLRLSAPAVVVNALTLAPGRCRRCRSTAAYEARELAALPRLCARRCVIIRTPLVAPAPRGARALAAWAHMWTTNGGFRKS